MAVSFRDWIAGRTAVTIADADEFYVRDADADESKRITWSTIRSVVANDTGYDIVILAGQSNMSGRGLPYNSTSDPSHPDVFMWNNTTSEIVTATEPLIQRDTPTGIGPGLSFAKGYARTSLARGRKVLLVGTAVGGTDLVSASAPTWNSATVGSYFDQSVSDAQAALAAADAEGGTNEIVGVLWCQGETNTGTYAQYRAAYEALIAAYRTDLGISDLPFVALSMTRIARTASDIRRWITAVHATMPFDDMAVGFVDAPYGQNFDNSTTNKNDTLHYNSDAQRQAGASMATEFALVKSSEPRTRDLPLDVFKWQTLASDDFTRADGALGNTPTGGYAWAGNGTVSSNQLAIATTTGGEKFAFIGDIGVTDYRFTLTCVSGPAALPMGVVWDRVGTDNFYAAEVDRDLGVWRILMSEGASTTYIHVSDTPFANGDVVQVVNIDQACAVSINGTVIHTFSKKPHAVGTTPIRMGAWALNTSATTSTFLWDDFLVEVPDETT